MVVDVVCTILNVVFDVLGVLNVVAYECRDSIAKRSGTEI
jgi:hypothetical protein